MTQEIERCETCTGACNEAFAATATELLVNDDGTERALEVGEDKERLLKYRLQAIIGCTLTSREITANLEGLMEGTRNIHGR